MSHASDFVGTWSLRSFKATTPEGDVVDPLGAAPIGRITYHSDGRMSVQVMSRHRPPFSTEDPTEAPWEEVVQAFGTYIAYLGTYSVDTASGTVLHHLEVASIPNWVGTTQRRNFTFGEDTLELSTPPIPLGGRPVQSVLLWERDEPA